MVYMCVICMTRDGLEPLPVEYRGVLESLVSPAVKSAELRKLMLLTCGACLSLIKTLDMFQKTAIIGVKNLLQFSSMNKKLTEGDQVPIKEEPPGKNNNVESETFLEIELEAQSDNKLQDWIKSDASPCNQQGSSDNIGQVKVERLPTSVSQSESTAVFAQPMASQSNMSQTTNLGPQPGMQLVPQNMLMGTQYPNFSHPQLMAYYMMNPALNQPQQPPQTQKVVKKRGRPALKKKSKSKAKNVPKSSEMGKPPYCTRVFPYRNMLFARVKERSRPEFANAPFRCSSCVLVFVTEEDMDAHVREHVLGPDELPCKVCALPIHSSNEGAHDTKHASRHQCTRCLFSTEHRHVIEAHDCSEEPLKRLRRHERKVIVNPVKCEICASKYADVAALNRHMERMHKNPEEFKCNICSRTFDCKKKLSCHVSFHKRQENTLSALSPELHCAECNIVFTSPATYRAHRMTLKHTTKDTWKFECDVCKNKFPRKPFLKRHIRVVHLKERANVCNLCGKTVVNPRDFRNHMERHKPSYARTKPHVCELCGKAFAIKKSLTEHMSMHNGLRPHQCPHCPATFTYSAALFTHNRLKHLKMKRNWKKEKKEELTETKLETEAEIMQLFSM